MSLSLPCSKCLYLILKGMCYLLFHPLFTRPILWPPRSKAVTYTQNNWFYLISAAHNSSVRCLSNLPESILSLHINFPVTFFLCLFFLSPPPNLLFTQVSLSKLYIPLHVTYINTGLFTPAAHAYGLRPLRAPQARASQLNSPALSSPRLKPCRSLPPGRGQLQLPSVVHLYVAISSWYYTYNKREKEICAYTHTHTHTYIYPYMFVCSPLVGPRL